MNENEIYNDCDDVTESTETMQLYFREGKFDLMLDVIITNTNISIGE
ncbi:MAG: hypothetical protein IKU52_05670 [Clostridia bacterium]|nr:hypothetical protein [Clostridia bacterium]